MNPVLKKLHMEGKKFVTSDEIKEISSQYGLDHGNTVRNLMSRGHLLRILRGIFYVKSFDEVELGRMELSHLELVSKGLELKGVDDWYFGLYTALKLNNITHEHFPIDYVVSGTIFRKNPINMAGYKFKFVKIKESLLGFGIKENRYRYSDLEKTILDFIYLWRYNGKTNERILMDISDYARDISMKRMRNYSTHYPKTVQRVVEELD